LLHNHKQIPGEESEFVIEHLSSQTTPVNQVLASLHRVAMAQKDILTWGGIPKFQADRMCPTIRIAN
jgi:hypothetical protein